MKTQKLRYVFAAVLLFAAMLSSNLVRANDRNDNNNQDNNGGNEDIRMEAHRVGSTLEIHVYDNGKVNVRGAKVTAISGNTISATTSLGAFSLNWQVNVSSDVKLVRKSGGVSSVSEIYVGAIVSVRG